MSQPDIVDELRSIDTWLISVDAMARAQWIAQRSAVEIERLRAAAECSRQAIQYSIDMGTTDPAGILLQAMNKCDSALSS